jgi:N-acetylglucosaminyldiphosphoundecaprenol N-acetyl-beta-D-mannosaminyltransferase
MSAGMLPKLRVLTADITVGSFARHVEVIADAAAQRRSSYVCCVNAHMTVECKAPDFAAVVNSADLATADGMPVLKVLNWTHGLHQERVAGNDLMPALLERAAQDDLAVYLYGGSQDTLDRIKARIARELPALRLVGAHSPPFGPLSAMDMEAEAARINATGAQIIMVSLGCPKQERWMAAMKGRVQGVMLGLGGAFLLYAGVDSRAPKWMRDLSLEWMYRLLLEPRRLWKRYLVTNSAFIVLMMSARIRRLLGKG